MLTTEMSVLRGLHLNRTLRAEVQASNCKMGKSASMPIYTDANIPDFGGNHLSDINIVITCRKLLIDIAIECCTYD
jgi:hypothetical protein